ncbi:MAG: hypothetical protein IJF45_03465 [Clostridia bacterium]|nr:hypothetical protein [Clostridia bacterium]
MSSLLILIKMQLKEQLNFQRFDLKGTNWFKIAVSVLAAVAKFALVTVLCGAFLIVAKLLGLFSLTNTVPSTVISLVFSLMLLDLSSPARWGLPRRFILHATTPCS